MVVGMSLYSQIREAYTSGESQRSIAKRLGVSRQTVKKYCGGATMPGVRKKYLRAPSVVTPEIEQFIRICLDTDKKEGLRKQVHTAKRIYDRLVTEMGFAGSYSIVRRVVHEMRAQDIPSQADMDMSIPVERGHARNVRQRLCRPMIPTQHPLWRRVNGGLWQAAPVSLSRDGRIRPRRHR